MPNAISEILKNIIVMKITKCALLKRVVTLPEAGNYYKTKDKQNKKQTNTATKLQ